MPEIVYDIQFNDTVDNFISTVNQKLKVIDIQQRLDEEKNIKQIDNANIKNLNEIKAEKPISLRRKSLNY